LLVAALGCSNARHEPISSAELEKVRAADQTYATAWLTNDSEQVMATLTADAVLLPSGMPAIEGTEKIRQFWWPEDSPPTKVTEFTLVQQEVDGYGDIGFVRGSFSLGFEYDGDTYSNRGDYLSLLRRGSDGSWRISHHMWNDQPPQTEE
jgi:uncharacterized protein (TIGR02246 family)